MKIKFVLLFVAILSVYSCTNENTGSTNITKESFDGYVQKGPFINGSSITIYVLDETLNQTGASYNTSISSNSGKFEMTPMVLSSSFVKIQANGYYFNENSNVISSAPLVLNAIVDVSVKNSANVNLLTHLEAARIEYLVTHEELSFEAAKNQAMQEVLNIFSIKKEDVVDAETLNFMNDGDDNAILLAVSAILQGYRTTGELSELIADIVTDIKEDGILNDSTIGTKLLDDAKFLDLETIRHNLELRYQNLTIDVAIPDFEKYVSMFIDSTSFQSVKAIDYPNTTSYGTNILCDSVTQVTPIVFYSLAANLPLGMNLRVVLKGGMWAYSNNAYGPVNWNITDYSYETQSQTFTSESSGTNCDLKIIFDTPTNPNPTPNPTPDSTSQHVRADAMYSDTISIEYYENNATTPTRIKSLIVR